MPPQHQPAPTLDSRDWFSLAAILLLTIIVFANGITGDFVHDDNRQIVRNDLIRDPHRWKQALTHDIWSFLGQRDRPWSNYWRPGHVAWLIMNFQLFGGNPVGWHVTSLLAHLAVVALAFVTIRRLGATRWLTSSIVAIFAVHPTRAESVTWIAGVHDVLCTLWQLAALLCVMSIWRHRDAGRRDRTVIAWKWLAAMVFFALAILTKEIAIFFPVIVALVRITDPRPADHSRQARIKSALSFAIPFACIGLAFLAARLLVLGRMQLTFPFRMSARSVVATLPIVVATYLRQMAMPYWMGWNYPVRAVTGENTTLLNFWLPILLLAVITVLALRVKWDRLRLIGAAIMVLTLLPALNLFAFPPDSLVKDRFLYFPLLGFLMIVVPLGADLLRRAPAGIAPAVAALIIVLLSVRTISYNTAWRSEVAMWQWACWSDPDGASNHHQLAVALLDAGRVQEARREIDRTIEMSPFPKAFLALSDVCIKQGRFSEAIAAARTALAKEPDPSAMFAAYERLAVAYEKLGQLDEAAAALREARERVPFRRAFFTDELAVILYKRGDREGALRELEGARSAAETEFSPTARLVLFHLGMLYGEMGRQDEGRQALERFLQLTDGSADPLLADARRTALAALGRPIAP